MLAIFAPHILGLLFRHALTLGGGFLIAQGIIEPGTLDGLAGCFETNAPTNDTAATVLGGIAAAAGLVWSGAEKRKRPK